MRLQVALLPPRDVQEQVAAIVAAVPGGVEQLDLVPSDLLYLRLASFSKVALGDFEAMRDAIGRETAQWPPMRLRLKGGAALEPVGDESVWARLEGDLEQLDHITDLIIRVVRRMGFVLDRRLSRTLVRLGRVTPDTTVESLQQVIDRLDDYTSRDWTCHDVVLLRVEEAPPGTAPPLDVLHRFRFAAEDPIQDAMPQLR